MKIISFKAENIKKLVAVEINPAGNVVEITGKNGQGKTSVLDAISWALEGSSHIQGEPIRKGQEKGWVKLDLGDIVVERTFRKSESGETTSSISVKSKDGAKFPSPQSMLDNLIGRLAFDPLAFARMEPKAQFDTLRRFVPDVDFDKIENLNRGDFARRTDINRKAKEARAAASMIEVSEVGEVEVVDEAALVDQMEQAVKHNASIEERKMRREQFEDKRRDNLIQSQKVVEDAKSECDRIMLEAKRRCEVLNENTQKRSGELIEEATAISKKLSDAPALPDPIDVSELRKKIAKAREVNDQTILRQRKRGLLKDAEKLEVESKEITLFMDGRDKTKRDAIQKAALPVPGLGFGEGIVNFNGVPFDQASDAEQLRVSIAIAMSLNPKLKVIRVRDGSLLDEDSMKLLAEMAQDKDYQVWVERVDGSGKVGIVLEDGRVREQVAAAA